MVKSKGLVWLPIVKQSMVIVPTSLSSKHTDYDTMHRRLCHASDKTIRKMSTFGIKGIHVNCTHGSRAFCRSCDVAKSTVANINRESTRIDDPDNCLHTLTIDIWGPVNTLSIENFSNIFGHVCCKSAFIMVELIKIKSDSIPIFVVFFVRYDYLATVYTKSELIIMIPKSWEQIFKQFVKSLA